MSRVTVRDTKYYGFKTINIVHRTTKTDTSPLNEMQREG